MKTFIDSLDKQFLRLDSRARELVQKIPREKLYRQPKDAAFSANSCGELVLRSAAAVEQTFGGITTRLWDDPFEWTLPEALSTNDLILNYLSEVEATRARGFSLFQSDADLRRELPAPEKLTTIFALLIETLARAEYLQGRAFAVWQILLNEKSSNSDE